MHSIRSFAALALLAPACSLPPAPTDAAAVPRVLSRGASAAELEEALAWAAREALPREALGIAGGTPSSPEDVGFWTAAAWTWSSPCREARRRLAEARARRKSAGLPEDAGLSGSYRNHDGTPFGEHETDLSLTLDLLGLLHLGRAPAAAALADAEVRHALGRLEEVAWAARHEVERARLSVAAGRAREATLLALVEEVHADARRLAVLDEHGFASPDRLAAARAMSRRVERRLADERVALADALERLSRASGLPPGAPEFDAVTPNTARPPEEPSLPGAAPSPEELLARLPRLRAARLAYAAAEAGVRRAAAEAWPHVALGPSLRVHPDPLLTGGVLDVRVPWPGSVRGEVDAAAEDRERAREELEDVLRDALAAVARAEEHLDEATAIRVDVAPRVEEDTAAAWRAARARFGVDVDALPEWTDRLERRIEGCTALVEAREEAARAAIDLREAAGPALSPDAAGGAP